MAIAGIQGAAQRAVGGGPGALKILNIERIGADGIQHAASPEHPPTARGQLQGKRQPVETATHLGHHPSGVGAQVKGRRGAADAIDQKLDR
jgi:hypothetical protein